MHKFCRDCQHAEKTPPDRERGEGWVRDLRDQPHSWRCKRPKYDLVSGQSWENQNMCSTERINRSSEGYCGEEGFFFTPISHEVAQQ